MDGLIHQTNHAYVSTSVAQSQLKIPLDCWSTENKIWQEGLKLEVQTSFSFKVSFKRDVGIVWEKRERNPKDEDESDLSRGHWENKRF